MEEWGLHPGRPDGGAAALEPAAQGPGVRVLLSDAYLRASPRTDEERKDAADLALKGAAICLLGLIFPPVLLVGVLPLFYGVRKLVYTSMGLGLLDDGEGTQTGA